MYSHCFLFFRKNLLKRLIFVWTVIGLLSTVQAQQQQTQIPPGTDINALSDDQVEAFYRRAQASGMSEMQIEQAALAQGFTLDDISKMRQRLSQVQSGKTKSDKTTRDSTTGPRNKLNTLSQRRYTDSVYAIKPKKGKLALFGANFFNQPSSSFEPNLRIATPKNYQLGPDDELLVDISGNASESYRLRVSAEGTVKILNFAPIFVSGLNMEEAKEKIVGRLRQAYSGINAGGGTYAVINLGNIRSIKVIITGEVKKPGTYTVSSLATAFNVLYLCGGPDTTGTYRNIRIIRGNKLVKTIDLYDFLLNADQAGNVLLQDQDIIHVPFYGNRVELDGEVKRPAVYELTEDETLKNLLQYAGGYNSQAYKASLTVRRNTDREQKLLDVPQANIANFKPESGDHYQVGKILTRFENRVQITGAIFRSGEYALTNDLQSVKQLVEKAEGLREDAFRNRAILHRLKENLEPEIIAVDLGKVLSGESPDITLKRQDSLVVKSVRDLREEYFVTILGEINLPGDELFAENMTVSDLVAQAGGFTEGAIGSRIEIARRVNEANSTNLADNQTVQVISLKIDRKLSLNANDAEFKLKPFDIVYIRKSPRYTEQKSAIIAGEVNYSGVYPIAENSEKISSLIQRAGGIKANGYLAGAVLRRKDQRVAIDARRILEDPNVEGNILLQDGDSLFIPQRSDLVEIAGAVLNQTLVNYSKQFSYEDYVSQAGGYSERARKGKVYVTYSNGYTDRTRKFLFFNVYPKIEPGSVITVPFRPKDERKSEISGPVLLSFVGTMLVVLATIFR